MTGEKLKIQRRREIHTDEFRRRVLEEIAGLAVPFRIVLEPIGPKVTSRKRGLYYHALGLAADHCGYPVKALDRYFRDRYCVPIIVEEYGHELAYRPQFTDLSATERDMLVDKALALCEWLGLAVDQGDARYEPRH